MMGAPFGRKSFRHNFLGHQFSCTHDSQTIDEQERKHICRISLTYIHHKEQRSTIKMPREATASSPASTHRSIEEALEFINSKIKKQTAGIERHTDKVKHYRQIIDTLDGEIRWRARNIARLSSSDATPSPKKVFSNKRPTPIKEEVEENGTSVKRGWGCKKLVSGPESGYSHDTLTVEDQLSLPSASAGDSSVAEDKSIDALVSTLMTQAETRRRNANT